MILHRCARCNRQIRHPVVLGDMAFGVVCAKKVAGPTRRRHARAETVQRVRDPAQADLFEGMLP